MNQAILPIIPQGVTPINAVVGVFNEGKHWVYFLGMHPIYRHGDGDPRGFRLTVAQLVDSGACRASEVIAAFGIFGLQRQGSPLDERGAQAHRKRPSGQLECHRLRAGSREHGGRAFQTLVSRELLSIYDGTL